MLCGIHIRSITITVVTMAPYPTNSNESYCTFTLASDVTAGGLPSEAEIAKDLESNDDSVSYCVCRMRFVSGACCHCTEVVGHTSSRVYFSSSNVVLVVVLEKLY